MKTVPWSTKKSTVPLAAESVLRDNPKMKFRASILFFLLPLLLGSNFSRASLFSTNAGRVGDHVVTTREVMIYHLIEQALGGKNIEPKIQLAEVTSRSYLREITSVLIENAVFFEAEVFSAAPLEASRLKSQMAQIRARLNAVKLWQSLDVSDAELRQAVTRKIRAKDFVRFKIDSAAIPISDAEAKKYFEQNQSQFENLPFTNFKENIKSYLTKQQVDHRLKDWFELLQSKYKVRNYLSE